MYMAKEKIKVSIRGLDNPIQPLCGEYEAVQALFDLQPALTQRFLEAQGRQLADFILQNQSQSQARFTLPDRVVTDTAAGNTGDPAGFTIVSVPSEYRDQVTGGVIDRLTRSDMRTVLRQRLVELEGSNRKGVSVSAQLIRFATARFMIYSMLPSGRSVQYSAPDGEEIPSIPVDNPQDVESAITEQTDAIVETDELEHSRGQLQVPFVPYARRFFLPQWVAFGQEGTMLVNSVREAETHVASMQRFLTVLHAAVSLAPYFMADGEYQKKRYGMLGQLVNQGRELARYQTAEIIQVIKHRAASHDLNRGLSLSLPFFDDQGLEIRTHDFTIIPTGRIMFAPAFVVRASREEQAKVAQDTRLSPSTRKYLILQLKMLENAFFSH
jgi:hypothetical protein